MVRAWIRAFHPHPVPLPPREGGEPRAMADSRAGFPAPDRNPDPAPPAIAVSFGAGLGSGLGVGGDRGVRAWLAAG